MTVVASTSPVRLRPAPALDPPSDTAEPPDAIPDAEAVARQPELPLRWGRAPAAPPRRIPPPVDPEQDIALRRALRRLLDVCVEIMRGNRPLVHLRAVTTPAGYACVTDQLAARPTIVDRRRDGRRPRRASPPVAVQRAHIGRPHPDAAEVAATIVTGEAVIALALRLERHETRWLCTHLTLV